VAQTSIRFSDELQAKLQALADAEGRTFTHVVVRACQVTVESGDVTIPEGYALVPVARLEQLVALAEQRSASAA
jgi:hypothetical protein